MRSISKSSAFLGVCVFLLLTAFSHGEEAEKRLRLVHDGFSAATAIVWVGLEAGLFQRYHLAVEEVFLQDASSGGVQALLGGDLFVASANLMAPLQAIVSGAELVFIGSHANREKYKFGVAAGIRSIGELKGKKIGMSRPGGRSDLIARVVLRRASIDPVDEVEMVAVGFSPARAAALSRNLIQGAPLSPEVAAEAGKLGVKVLDIKEVPIVTSLLITTRSKVKEEEEAVRRFLKGYVAAIHYYLTHRDETIRIIGKQVSAADPAVLESIYDTLAAQMHPWPIPNGEAVQAMLDAVTGLDKQATKLMPPDLFELRFLDELKASGFVEDLYAEKVKL